MVLSLVINDLDGTTVERAGALAAREHAAACQVRPELPSSFEDAGSARPRQHPAGGRYARLPAEGFAVDPDLADPTGVLAAAFGNLASPLIAGGVLRYYLLHAALPRLPEALSNSGFGRSGAYGIQPAAARRGCSAVTVRIAGAEDLDTVARLALVEIQYRSAPPMFAPPRLSQHPLPERYTVLPRLASDLEQVTVSPSAGPPSPMPSRTLTDNLRAPTHICLLLR